MTLQVIVVGDGDNQQLTTLLGEHFTVEFADSGEACSDYLSNHQVAAIILRISDDFAVVQSLCQELTDSFNDSRVPIIVLSDDYDLERIKIFYDAGCDDFIGLDALPTLELRIARIMQYHESNQSMKDQLQHANNMVFSAMSDTSDLGVNIQFLVESTSCKTLEALGDRLFQSLKNYHVDCSLQFRSHHCIRNLEPNGSSRDIESALMLACKDEGRYVDFGPRTIMNYGNVSVLVKNMPIEDPLKYGSVKDNIFSLLQGADACVTAIDNLVSLELESELVRQMASQIRELIARADASYQGVMQDIASVVENMAEGIDENIQVLGMDEQQEQAIQKVMEQGIASTSRIFNEGIRVDEGLQKFLAQVDAVFSDDHADAALLQQLIRDMPNSSGTLH